MTKQEFVALYKDNMGISSKKEAERLINGFFSTLEVVLEKGEELSVMGFGKFEVISKPERVGRNPKTGQEIKIPARRAVKFKAGKSLADKVNK